jgi:hypothetical protein
MSKQPTVKYHPLAEIIETVVEDPTALLANESPRVPKG